MIDVETRGVHKGQEEPKYVRSTGSTPGVYFFVEKALSGGQA